MSTTLYEEPLNSVAERMLGYVLAALGLPAPLATGAGNGMPAATVYVGARGIVISTTPVDAPLFRPQLEKLATGQVYDVLLVRSGFTPEVLDPVSVDVCLGAGPHEPVIMNDLAFFRSPDGELWLVPGGSGPCVAIRQSGLELELLPPYGSMDERSDGTCLAAREIVLMGRGRSR